MSHDESLHVFYSWQLAIGKGFVHNPMMHGPFLFESTALMNVLFGASDFSSRLVSALLGTCVVVVVPQLLKSWLGRIGALITSALFLISPYILYYSRYIRHDIQVIAWMLLAVVAIVRYLNDRRDRYLFLLAGALALMFATMETTFIYLAIFTSFLVVRSLARYRLRWRTIRQSAEFDLLVVMATLGAVFSSPIALVVLNPIWLKLSGALFIDMQALSDQGTEWAIGLVGVRLWGLLAAFSIAAITIGLWWGRKRWLKLAGTFTAITVVLYTTFFSNLAGLGTGLIGSLGYWLSQQGVARGSQPGYYYLIVFPLYEYLPLIGGICATSYYLICRRSLSAFSRLFVPFTIWWAASILVALSLAGEKMPWLSTHIAVPFILLTGWWIGQLLEGAWHWRPRFSERVRTLGRGSALGVMGLLAVLTVRTSYAVNYLNYDYTTEFIDYAHGAPGVKWALNDIAAIANHTGAGRSLKIAYDDEVSWPMTWYLRDYPNQVLFGAEPNRAALDASIVIAGPKNWTKVEALLGNRYHHFELIRLWWPIEDYKNLSGERIQSALSNPEMRTALWDILWSRDYTRYAQLTNQVLNPPSDWPLAERMRVYVQKDIAAQMLSLSLGSMMLPDPEPADAYATLERPLSLTQVIATGNLNAPRGIVTAPDGTVYVADTGNSRLVKFNRAGQVLATWGSKTPAGQASPAPNTFNEPWGVAVDAQGNIYVADTWNHRVQKLDANGRFLSEWSTVGPGTESDKLWGPRGIVVSIENRVYVTDTGNKRVVVFNTTGKFLFEFDTSGDGRLDEPVGIALGPDRNVYVADTWNSRVAIFSPDGKYLSSWPVQGWTGDSLDNKPYLAVDAQGRVYLTDPERYRVIVFSSQGQPLAAFGQNGSEENVFALPTGLTIDATGAIWLADAGNNRVVRFEALLP
jgi:uncharacterized protein (TIGR03663 family)